MRVALNGTAVPPPILSVTAPLERGGARHFMAIRIGQNDGAKALVLINQEAAPAVEAKLDLSSSGLPDLEPNSLLDGLEKIGRVRLARFLLELCASTFRLSQDASYTQAMQRLLDVLNPRPGPLSACAAIEAHVVLCQTTVSAGIAPLQSAVVVSRNRIEPVVSAPEIDTSRLTEGKSASAWLMMDGRQIKTDCTVVIFGKHGLAVRRHIGPRPSVPNVLDWLRETGRKSGSAVHHVIPWLTQGSNGARAALAREIAALHGCGPGTQADLPIELSMHCCVATKHGIFIAGQLSDRYQLARTLTVEGGGFRGEIAIAALTAVASDSSDATGWAFIGLVRGSGAPEPSLMRITLVLRSGAAVAGPTVAALTTGIDARRAILQMTGRSAPTRAAVEHIIGPALDGLHDGVQAEPLSGMQMMQFGSELHGPKISLIMPFSRARSSLTAQAGALCTQRGNPAFEIIRILDRPEAQAGAERALDHIWKCFGLGSRLLCVPRGSSVEGAIATAARSARGECIVLLGSDVIPEQSTSLSLLTGRVLERSGPVVCGGRVLNPDMSMNAPRFLSSEGRDNGFSLEVPLAESADRENTRLVALSCKALAIPRMLIQQIGAPCAAYLTDHWRDAEVSARALRAGAFLIHEHAAIFRDFSATFDSPGLCSEWDDMIDARRFTAEWSERFASSDERSPELQSEIDANQDLRAA